MRLALLLYKYFPYGGMQRDFLAFTAELQKRGCECRIYTISWQGDPLPGADLRQVPVSAFSNYRRDQRFLDWVQADLASDPVDGVIGFNKMPGLDVYFAADSCFLDKAEQRSWWHRRGARYHHFTAWEKAVFGAQSHTRILSIAQSEQDKFQRHYQTAASRFYLLPPGVDAQQRSPEDALAQRRAKRKELAVEAQELLLLLVGSGFVTKGLDRAIRSLATLREQQPSQKARLLVVGQDKPRRFRRLSKRLGVQEDVVFLGGRDDVDQLMLAADLLLHPARNEAGGVVLLEAIVAGLPIVVTDVCGYAPYVKAARAGLVLPSPFSQDDLNRAVMRNIDGVFRADCRESALLYARITDIYSMHSAGADLIVEFIRQKRERQRG